MDVNITLGPHQPTLQTTILSYTIIFFMCPGHYTSPDNRSPKYTATSKELLSKKWLIIKCLNGMYHNL